MPAIVYPATLPGPSAWRVTPAERTASSGMGGNGALRPRWRDRQRDVEASWVYSPEEMRTWVDWRRDDLLLGQRRGPYDARPWGAATTSRSASRPRWPRLGPGCSVSACSTPASAGNLWHFGYIVDSGGNPITRSFAIGDPVIFESTTLKFLMS
jgi:hypothetical protein